MKIEISQEDFEFLKELQHELNTQPTDGNAQPVYWGVMETETVGVPDGCGEPIIYMGDGVTMELEEVVEYIKKDYLNGLNVKQKLQWKHLDKESMSDVVDFMHDVLKWNDTRIVYISKKDKISQDTGAFLTKRACKEYIEHFGYNHSNPHTYAMTAYRNFELERLLNILKSINFE